MARPLTAARIAAYLKYRWGRIESRYWDSNNFAPNRIGREQFNKRVAHALQTQRPGLYRATLDMFEARGMPAFHTSGKYMDVWALYTHVRRTKPAVVVECGAGFSTLAMAWAVRDNHITDGVPGRLYALDDARDYLQNVVTPELPARVRDYVEIIPSPVMFHEYKGNGLRYEGISYQSMPDIQPDFVYVDGPQVIGRKAFTNLAEGFSPTSLTQRPFDADVLRIAMASDKPVDVLFDMRIDSMRKMKALCPTLKTRFLWRSQKTAFTFSKADASHVEVTPLVS